MKTKHPILLTCGLAISLLISYQSLAQQPKHAARNNSAAQQMSNPFANNYSFRLYSAPNNGYGFDILKSGAPVYHQFVLMFMTNDGKRILVAKPEVQKAAAFAIEKIRKGMPPSLTEAEVKKIAGYQN